MSDPTDAAEEGWRFACIACDGAGSLDGLEPCPADCGPADYSLDPSWNNGCPLFGHDPCSKCTPPSRHPQGGRQVSDRRPTPDQSYCNVGLHGPICSGFTEDEGDPETCMCECHDEDAHR